MKKKRTQILTLVTTLSSKLVHLLLRIMGRNAESLPGGVALKLYPGILEHLASGMYCVCVTGTNGKTTTVQVLSRILREYFEDALMENTVGANISQSIAFGFIRNTDALGRMKRRYAVIECDEAYMPVVCETIKPKIVVFTNLSKDQTHRFSSLEFVYDRVKRGLMAACNPILCANADDEYAAKLAGEYEGPTFLFGKKRPSDNGVCLSWDGEVVNQTANGFSYSLFLAGEGKIDAESKISGTHNVFNIMAALCVCKAMGLPISGCVSHLKKIPPVNGRMSVFHLKGLPMIVSLVKNNISFKVMADYVMSLDYDTAIVLLQAAKDQDDRDTGWISETDLVSLKSFSHLKRVFITGDTAEIWAGHFLDNGFDPSTVSISQNIRNIVLCLEKLRLPAIWLPCYSEYLRFKKHFEDRQ